MINTFIPVLSPSDKRSIIKSLWDPFISFSNWELTGKTKQASAFVYLDASGSMFPELKYLVKVLKQFSDYKIKPSGVLVLKFLKLNLKKDH